MNNTWTAWYKQYKVQIIETVIGAVLSTILGLVCNYILLGEFGRQIDWLGILKLGDTANYMLQTIFISISIYILYTIYKRVMKDLKSPDYIISYMDEHCHLKHYGDENQIRLTIVRKTVSQFYIGWLIVWILWLAYYMGNFLFSIANGTEQVSQTSVSQYASEYDKLNSPSAHPFRCDSVMLKSRIILHAYDPDSTTQTNRTAAQQYDIEYVIPAQGSIVCPCRNVSVVQEKQIVIGSCPHDSVILTNQIVVHPYKADGVAHEDASASNDESTERPQHNHVLTTAQAIYGQLFDFLTSLVLLGIYIILHHAIVERKKRGFNDSIFLKSSPFLSGIFVLLLVGLIYEACGVLPTAGNNHVNVVSVALSAFGALSFLLILGKINSNYLSIPKGFMFVMYIYAIIQCYVPLSIENSESFVTVLIPYLTLTGKVIVLLSLCWLGFGKRFIFFVIHKSTEMENIPTQLAELNRNRVDES